MWRRPTRRLLQQEFGLALSPRPWRPTSNIGAITPEIPDMDRAADRLEGGCSFRPEKILIFGDFDLDGISATTVLTQGFARAWRERYAAYSQRFEEGYGLTPAAFERAKGYYNLVSRWTAASPAKEGRWRRSRPTE